MVTGVLCDQTSVSSAFADRAASAKTQIATVMAKRNDLVCREREAFISRPYGIQCSNLAMKQHGAPVIGAALSRKSRPGIVYTWPVSPDLRATAVSASL